MRQSSARRRSPALVSVLFLLALAGCSEGGESAPEPSPTPITELDTAAMQVPRIDFCKLVPPAGVRAALAGKPESAAAYGNGDEVDLPGVGEDVVHEIGCSWASATGDTARAWVFARPVDAAFARTIVRGGRQARGCRTAAGPAFGRPSTTQVCRLPDGAERVRHAGLFGQTWLSCELTAAAGSPIAADLRPRTDRWCVEVATALDTGR